MTREVKVLWLMVALLAGFVAGSLGALAMESSSTAVPLDLQLADQVAEYYADPLGFVLFAYPWGEPGELESFGGPDQWQTEILTEIGDLVRGRGFNGVHAVDPIREAVSSGHGIGKSTLVAWLVDWIMSTRPGAQGTVTANTVKQLDTKTWPQIQKWTKLCITAHWFDVTSELMWRKGRKEDWFCSRQTCKEENAEAFQGQHAATSTSFYVFDEASAVPDAIYEAAEGGLTDGEPHMYLFGNPTRSSGKFHRVCFGSERNRWRQRCIDSRTAAISNKKQIAEWIEDYGDDSDFVRVRVLGLAPRASDLQYIDTERIAGAQKRKAMCFADDPLIVGVDVARGGSANTVIRFRRGLDGRTIPPIRLSGEESRDSMRVAAVLLHVMNTQWGGLKPSAAFVDSGFGGPIVDRCHQLGHSNVVEVSFGGECPDPRHYANMRVWMWSKMRDWLPKGAIDAKDARLETDLAGPGYHHDKRDRILLESKEDMQKRGLDSPDDGDALALTFAYPVAKLELGPQEEADESGGGGHGESGWMV